jgi:hypothetical protein
MCGEVYDHIIGVRLGSGFVEVTGARSVLMVESLFTGQLMTLSSVMISFFVIYIVTCLQFVHRTAGI